MRLLTWRATSRLALAAGGRLAGVRRSGDGGGGSSAGAGPWADGRAVQLDPGLPAIGFRLYLTCD